MNSNPAAKAADVPLINDTDDSKRQWEEINDQLRDMQLMLSEGISSPLSSSPANLNAAVVTRSHNNQYNPLYRRSEGDILGTTLSTTNSANPPQSAPVLPEGYELKWDKQKPFLSGAIGNMQEVMHGETPGKILIAESSLLGAIPEINHVHSRSAQGTEGFSYMRHSSSSPLTTIHPAVKLQGTSSNASHQYSPFPAAETSHAPMYTLHHQTSSPLLQTHKSSPSARRKSAPITTPFTRNRSTPRMLSQIPNVPVITNIFPAFSEEEFTRNVVQSPDDGKQKTDVINNDMEYTRALLQHQRERMIRLEKEIEAKKNELKLLYDDVKVMEYKVQQRNSSNKALPTLQVDVSRLREINRKLKIDCNCMYKEVELFSRDGDSTRDDFYSRYNRPQSIKNKSKKDGGMRPMCPRPDLPPPPAPPPSDPSEEPKWRCSHCTFDNHSALNKCEICDFSRVITPCRT